jgi:hypothetical protein
MKVKLISLVSLHSEPNPDFYDLYVVLQTTYFDFWHRSEYDPKSIPDSNQARQIPYPCVLMLAF